MRNNYLLKPIEDRKKKETIKKICNHLKASFQRHTPKYSGLSQRVPGLYGRNVPELKLQPHRIFWQYPRKRA
jgi:YesN/AraC family two-component response regulator